MAFNRDSIEFQVRFTNFTYGGKVQNLKTKAGKREVPETLMNLHINESILAVNFDLEEDTNEQVSNTVKDSDEWLVPTDKLAIKDIVIFSDYEDTVANQTQSSLNQGVPLRKATTYADLIGLRKPTEDFGINYTGQVFIDPTPGIPSAYLFIERDNTRLLKFDRECDHAYYIEIYYVTIPATLTSGTQNPELADQYQSLIIDFCRMRIAEQLGDFSRYQWAEQSYEKNFRKRNKIVLRRNTPDFLRLSQIYL